MSLTYFLAEVIGFSCFFIGLSIVSRKSLFIKIVREIEGSESVMYWLGLMSLVAGLSMVLSYNIWNQGLLSLLITLFGWALVLKGISAMFVTRATIVRYTQMVKFEKLYGLYGLVVIVLGAYLICAGLGS